MSLDSQRERTLHSLTQEPVDVLVVGGGIVGAALARDAALRGLNVGLIEQHDFGFGTSSRSSRLLHGGLRYLAQGRIDLVREASVEKKIIHQIAPHLAEPLPFIFPTYRGNKHWVLWQLKIGVKIYDLLCGGGNLGRSSWLSQAEVLKKVPGLVQADLQGAVRYYDGFTNDARLTIDTLRSAERKGARILNYCRFQNAARGGRPEGRALMWSCQSLDLLAQRDVEIQARAVVNAAGPWADRVPHSSVRLRVTKGIHLVVNRARVPVGETVVMTEDKRILFAIPWGERTILGTTDTDYSGSRDHVVADAEDVEYVLRIVNRFFPSANLAAEDVVSTWAGLRPLIADPHGKPSDISREHQIRSPEPGWWDVAGGKLTTARLMAEQTLDQIVKYLWRRNGSKGPLPPCETAEQPLLPAAETADVSGILPPEVNRSAVEHYCLREWAVHLDDVMVRRTSWSHYHADADRRAERVADWMGEVHGWTEHRRAEELGRYRALTRAPGGRRPESAIPPEVILS